MESLRHLIQSWPNCVFLPSGRTRITAPPCGLILGGPSGSGKTYVLSQLRSLDLPVSVVSRVTTRAERGAEDAQETRSISLSDFEERRQAKDLFYTWRKPRADGTYHNYGFETPPGSRRFLLLPGNDALLTPEHLEGLDEALGAPVLAVRLFAPLGVRRDRLSARSPELLSDPVEVDTRLNPEEADVTYDVSIENSATCSASVVNIVREIVLSFAGVQ